MITILSALASLLSFRVRRRASLELELLRHQVTVLRCRHTPACGKTAIGDFVSNVHQNGPRPVKAGIFGVPSLETATRIDNSDIVAGIKAAPGFPPVCRGWSCNSKPKPPSCAPRSSRRSRKSAASRQPSDRRPGQARGAQAPRRPAHEADALAVKQELLEKTLAQNDKPTKSPRSERTAPHSAMPHDGIGADRSSAFCEPLSAWPLDTSRWWGNFSAAAVTATGPPRARCSEPVAAILALRMSPIS